MIEFVAQRLYDTDLSSIAIWSGPKLTFPLYALEPGAKRPTHPRIPAGSYPLRLRNVGKVNEGYIRHYLTDGQFRSDWHQGMVEICDVPGREAILFHVGNFIEDTEGCSLPGLHYGKDTLGAYRVFNSRLAYEQAYPVLRDAILAGRVTLNIKDIGTGNIA